MDEPTSKLLFRVIYRKLEHRSLSDEVKSILIYRKIYALLLKITGLICIRIHQNVLFIELYYTIVWKFPRNTGGQDDIHSAHFLVAKHQNEEYGNKENSATAEPLGNQRAVVSEKTFSLAR
ncbi:MAG: hypothetical protein WAW77_06965 [Caldibacillus thermoamylovorans]